jgi:hypothetical protein
MLSHFLVTSYICSQDHLLWWTKMESKSMVLIMALVAIIGPVAGKVYTECELATMLQNHGITALSQPVSDQPLIDSLRKGLGNYIVRM